MLPILDSFDMALQHDESSDNATSLTEGLTLIKKQIHTFLEKTNVTKNCIFRATV